MLCMRIFIADDHALVRRGLRALLEAERDFEVIGEAADGHDALRLCEALHPDIVILDLAMPKLNGIEVLARAVKRDQRVRVIVLSMYADEAYVLRTLAAGASAYLLKDGTDEDLVRAVRLVTAGQVFFSPTIATMLAESERVQRLKRRGLEDSYHLLTDREKEVLQLLAEGRSNKEAATLLDIGVSTVETHRASLMQKLDLHSTADIVLYAVRKRIII